MTREYQNGFQKFAKAVKYGPIFVCAWCHRKLFEQSVKVLDEAFREKLDEKTPNWLRWLYMMRGPTMVRTINQAVKQ